MNRWNTDIKNGKDTEFGRILKRDPKGKTAFAGREAPIVSEPLGDGPYYAVALYPTMLNTQGGPKKNVKGQVMDPQDKPIPRLYAAGELGSMWGNIYQARRTTPNASSSAASPAAKPPRKSLGPKTVNSLLW